MRGVTKTQKEASREADELLRSLGWEEINVVAMWELFFGKLLEWVSTKDKAYNWSKRRFVSDSIPRFDL